MCVVFGGSIFLILFGSSQWFIVVILFFFFQLGGILLVNLVKKQGVEQYVVQFYEMQVMVVQLVDVGDCFVLLLWIQEWQDVFQYQYEIKSDVEFLLYDFCGCKKVGIFWLVYYNMIFLVGVVVCWRIEYYLLVLFRQWKNLLFGLSISMLCFLVKFL